MAAIQGKKNKNSTGKTIFFAFYVVQVFWIHLDQTFLAKTTYREGLRRKMDSWEWIDVNISLAEICTKSSLGQFEWITRV